jgi:hypothetical protein
MNLVSSYKKTLRPETKLLLCCARTRVDDRTAEKIRNLVRSDIDWGYLLNLSRHHHMLPLLHGNLEAHCGDSVPNTVRKQLRNHFSANARRNLILTGELLNLLKLFKAHKISAVPFRGPTLAAMVHGDLALRQFGDLDILVRKHDVLRARDLLVSCGYHPLFAVPPREKAIFSRNEYGFVLDNAQIFIDLHWETTRTWPKQAEPFWQRLEPLSLEGHTISTLSKPDLFIHLCVHGAKHHWERLDWVCDVAELIRSSKEMDWGWIMEQAQTSGSRRMTCLGVYLAHQILGVDVPKEARREVTTDRKMESLAGQVNIRLFQRANSRNPLLEVTRFYLRTMDGWRDRIWHCLDRLSNPPPWSIGSFSLPPSLYFLYYLIRPLQLVHRCLSPESSK